MNRKTIHPCIIFIFVLLLMFLNPTFVARAYDLSIPSGIFIGHNGIETNNVTMAKHRTPTPTESGGLSTERQLTDQFMQPVLMGTPTPENIRAVTIEDAAQVTCYARWGDGVLSSMAWLGDDHELLLMSSTGLGVFSGESLSLIRSFDTGQWYNSMAVSHDGKMAALAGAWGDNTIYLVGLDNGEEIERLAGRNQTVYALSFSPDDSLLASGSGDGEIILWYLENGAFLKTLKGHEGAVKSIAFSPDGALLASASFDHSIRLWNIEQGEELALLTGHEQEVSSVLFSPDGQYLVSGGYDKVVLRWDVENKKYDRLIGGHRGFITGLDISPDGRWVAASSTDNIVKIWDIEGEIEISILSGHDSDVMQVVFSADGERLVSRSSDGVVMTWNVPECLSTKYCLHEDVLDTYTSRWLEVSSSPDGNMISVIMEGDVVELLETDTGISQSQLGYPTIGARGVLFTQDGDRLYLGTDEGKLSEWNVSRARKTKNLNWYLGDIHSTSLSSDGKWLASGGLWGMNNVSVWMVDSGKQKFLLEGHSDYITDTQFSYRQDVLASACVDGEVIIWSMDTGEELLKIEPSEYGANLLAFSPDDKTLAILSGDNTIMLVNQKTGAITGRLRDHSVMISEIIFSPDGEMLVTGDWDGNVALWDVRRNELVAILKGHSGSIKHLFFTDDGMLVSTSLDGTMRLWGVINGS